MVGGPSCGYFKSLKFPGWLVKMCGLVDKVILYHLQSILTTKKPKAKKPKQKTATCELKKWVLKKSLKCYLSKQTMNSHVENTLLGPSLTIHPQSRCCWSPVDQLCFMHATLQPCSHKFDWTTSLNVMGKVFGLLPHHM